MCLINLKITCAGHAHIWHWATLRVHTAWTQHFFSTTHHWANHVTITIYEKILQLGSEHKFDILIHLTHHGHAPHR